MHRFGLALVAIMMLTTAASAQGQAIPPTIPGNDAIFRHVENIVDFSPRRVGTIGIDKTVSYIGRKYREYGLTRVHVQEVPTFSWQALEHSLTVGGVPVDHSPIIYSQSPAHDHVGTTSTPAGGLKAPIVDVGLATPAEVAAHDVEGKIVMFDLKFLLPLAGLTPAFEFLWDPEQTLLLDNPQTLLTANPYITTYTEAIKAAQDAGAVGFIGVLADYFESNQYYNEAYRRQLVEKPGVWVTKAEGERLRAQLAATPDAEANLVMRSRRAKVPSHVVVGFLDGKSTDTIQIQSHHDSGFDGAVEDASGVAEVLALAEHYGRQPASSREKTLMFTTFDSHFSGYAAHQAFLKRYFLERDEQRDPQRIVANVTLEHIAKHGRRGADGALEVSELPEPRGVFENMSAPLKATMIDSIVRHDLRRTALLNAAPLQPVGIPTDASGWVILGIPTASLISGPNYLYDAADTVDKVLKSELQPIAAMFVELVDVLDMMPPDEMGVVPFRGAEALAGAFGNLSKVPRSVDRPLGGCQAAARGRAVTRVRLRGRRVTFRARRHAKVRITAILRDGTRRALRPRKVVACKRYRVRAPRRTVRVRVRALSG